MARTEKALLSLATATYNEEKNISACLTSIASIAHEIIVVDGGSHDGTVDAAKRFGARVIQTDNPPIFHINKQKALDECTGDWILQLDADEVITHDLKKEILDVINQQPTTNNQQQIHGYYIPRSNYFWGHWMRKGGQYPDYVIRLVRRGKAKFPCKSVHEQIAVSGKVGHLKNPMLHYSYRTREDYWEKADAYTTLTAKEFRQKRIGKTLGSWFYYSVIKPVEIFFSLFVRHKGFVDGLTGFEFAIYSGMHWAIAYKKFLTL